MRRALAIGSALVCTLSTLVLFAAMADTAANSPVRIYIGGTAAALAIIGALVSIILLYDKTI